MSRLETIRVTCLECGTVLGEEAGVDPYKHMLHCLHVEPDSLVRIREAAAQAGNEHGKRVIHIVDALIAGPSALTIREE